VNPALAVEESRSFLNIVDFSFLALHSKIRCMLTTCESLNLNLQSAVKIKCVNYGKKSIRKTKRGVNRKEIYRKIFLWQKFCATKGRKTKNFNIYAVGKYIKATDAYA